MKIKINEGRAYDQINRNRSLEILQEAPENIIPPAFNRLVAYARMGGTVPNEAMAVPRTGPSLSPEEIQSKYKEFLDKRVEQFGLPRAAQDTMAQLIVRYAGRSYRAPSGGMVDFALNPAGVQLVFTRAFRELRGDAWWQAYYKNVLNSPEDPSSEQLKAWRKEEEKIDNWISEEWGRRSTTAFEWTKKARKMAAEGAEGPELLIFMGRQYKSNIKSLKKWFKRNPVYAEVQAPLLEAVRQQWNKWQHRIINHAQGNLRKIGQYMKDNPNSYSSFNALIKKHPTRTTIDEFGLQTGRSSLFHISEFIDQELLKGQLDSCRNGWASADQGNAEDASDMSAPCVLHEYDDGFFWWNRRAASCDIAGDEMANCGSSNHDDSTLIILKEKVENDSMEAMDKMKGRIMVEYNSTRGSLEQVLGFANSFPEKKYWKYIKDLYDNLNVQEVSKWALKHLRDRGKTTQDDIDAFVEFVEGGTGTVPPEFFFTEEGEDSFIQRIKERKYNLESEANFGGRQAILFKAVHEQAEARWKPIEVELNIRALYYPQAPESLSTEEHPSVDPLFFENFEENANKIKGFLETFIRYGINDVMVNANVVSGENAKLAKKMFESFEFIRFELKKRTQGGLSTGIIRAGFDIPPEVFTDESSLAADVPVPQSAHAIVNKVRQRFGGDRLLVMLNNSISLLNSQLNPEEYTEFIPGVDDQEDGQVILNVGEITQEMDAIRRDFERGVSLDQMNQRLEILYTSLASPRDDDSGFMNIDAIHHTIADIWERWIEDDDYWSSEWFRLRRDSRQRVAAMRDELDDDQWADLSLPTEVTPGLPPGADQQANMQGYFPDDDDGPDEEERNWRPGMPTPGLRATDYEDPADIERDQARYVDFDNDGRSFEERQAEQLYERGALLLRFFAANPERVNDGAVNLFQRFKNEMERNGLWDEWWSQVPNDHPVANVLSGLQEDRIVVETNKILGEKKSGVESAHMNENNNIRKGGVLPFKKEEGEFYFLLGQAPQGWWSDFRGGEEAEDGGDLKVTAAREFTEESSFDLPVSLDDAFRIEHKNAAVYLADLAELNPEDFDVSKVMKINKGYLAGTPEIVAVQWYHINQLPQIPKSRMPIIEKALQMLTAPEPNATGMETTGGDAYTPFLNENTNITTLHVFDFDDTIAFTETHTVVTAPNGRKYKVNQVGLDKLLKSVDGGEDELRAKGFDLDFSGFKTVSPDSQINPVIARRIDACCLAGDRDPNGDFYVLTARAAAAEGPIHQYLADNGIEIDRSKVIGVEGKSKASRIKSLIAGSKVNRVIFYDDSDNNINDVAGLRQDPELQNVVFELYPVDEDGNIPENPMQETIYERKVFKIRIGAK